MRKSDLVVLIVLVALFGFSSWLLFSSGNESSVTGDVVFGGDINGEFEEEIGEEVLANCEIGSPFICEVWNFSYERGMVLLRLENSGGKDFLINSFNVIGCESKFIGGMVGRSSARVFEFSCSLVEGREFSGDIGLRYKDIRGGIILFSGGRVEIG